MYGFPFSPPRELRRLQFIALDRTSGFRMFSVKQPHPSPYREQAASSLYRAHIPSIFPSSQDNDFYRMRHIHPQLNRCSDDRSALRSPQQELALHMGVYLFIPNRERQIAPNLGKTARITPGSRWFDQVSALSASPRIVCQRLSVLPAHPQQCLQDALPPRDGHSIGVKECR